MTGKLVNALPMSQPSSLDRVRAVIGPLIPARFRGDIPVVPVVRLAGVIGVSSPLRPGLTIASEILQALSLPLFNSQVESGPGDCSAHSPAIKPAFLAICRCF